MASRRWRDVISTRGFSFAIACGPDPLERLAAMFFVARHHESRRSYMLPVAR